MSIFEIKSGFTAKEGFVKISGLNKNKIYLTFIPKRTMYKTLQKMANPFSIPKQVVQQGRHLIPMTSPTPNYLEHSRFKSDFYLVVKSSILNRKLNQNTRHTPFFSELNQNPGKSHPYILIEFEGCTYICNDLGAYEKYQCILNNSDCLYRGVIKVRGFFSHFKYEPGLENAEGFIPDGEPDYVRVYKPGDMVYERLTRLFYKYTDFLGKKDPQLFVPFHFTDNNELLISLEELVDTTPVEEPSKWFEEVLHACLEKKALLGD